MARHSTRKLAIHPYAEILPPMAEPERAALKADMEIWGQRQNIVLYQGKILDGRHRYGICLDLGLKPKFETFKGTDAEAREYVYSQSLHRNMSAAQQACAAVKFDLAATEFGKDRKLQNLQKNEGSVDVAKIATSGARSADLVGSRYGVSGRYISYAKMLYVSDRKLFNQVHLGVEPLARAVRAFQRTAKAQAHKKKLEIVRRSVDPGQIEIRTGDCLELAPAIMRQSARLIFCDPQYNIGYDYGKKSVDDELSAAEYLKFTETWMQEAHRILSLDGSLWVLICDEWAGEYAVLLKKLGFTIRNWIKWFESFGNNCANKFNRTSRHLFYCVKDPDHFVFNDFAVRRPSDRFAKYGDKRAVSGGKIWDDVWGINPPIPRLVDNAAERVPEFPTQLPLALVEPIVRVASEPYDQVMDFFSGSGTTAVACLRSHRKFLGFEKDKDFAARSRQRLAAIAGSKE